MKNPCLQIQSIARSLADQQMILKISIFNPENRTIYAYSVARRIMYNTISHRLTLCLHDSHIEENTLISKHLREPKVLELEANATKVMTLSLSKVVKRLKSHLETGGDQVSIEVLNIFEATEIVLEIGHQDTPFYFNPKFDMAKQLKEWAAPISKVSFKLDRDGKDIKR